MQRISKSQPLIDRPDHAFSVLGRSRLAKVEEFWVLALDAQKNLIQKKLLFRGTVDFCYVHPRDLFRFACLTNASTLIVAHNHPSGSCLPSPSDLEITRNLVRLSQLHQIPIIDHLIFSRDNYISLAKLYPEIFSAALN